MQDHALHDDHLPELSLLTGPDATDLVGAALAEAGGTPRSVKISQIRYVPAKSVTVQYRIEVTWNDGTQTREVYVAAAGIPVPDSVPIIEGDGIRVALWRFPADPFLPGLAAAAEPARAGTLLAQLGVTTDKVRTRTRAYRAGRRAVIEVTTPNARVFIKVVRPGRVADLQSIHRAMGDAVHIPTSLGWSEPDGIVVMQAMPGRTLRKAAETGSRNLPPAAALTSLLDQLPASLDREVPGARSRAAEHARLLSSILSDQAGRLEELVGALDGADDSATGPVHGDFHASQVLVRGASIVGLIDVDTAGTGRRSHDYGNFLGHLATLGLISPARKNVRRYGRELIDVFDREVDPAGLRLDVAGSVLGLATGPFRVFERHWPAQTIRRLELAEEWIAAARTTT